MATNFGEKRPLCLIFHGIAGFSPWKIRYKATEFRHYVVRRFPYIIFYVELEEAIWIVAVAHGRRRPDYWRRRRME